MPNGNSRFTEIISKEVAEKAIKEFFKTKTFSFPCYTCKHEGEETPRCDNYLHCGLWLDWARKNGVTK